MTSIQVMRSHTLLFKDNSIMDTLSQSRKNWMFASPKNETFGTLTAPVCSCGHYTSTSISEELQTIVYLLSPPDGGLLASLVTLFLGRRYFYASGYQPINEASETKRN